jgi:hypothetical protein
MRGPGHRNPMSGAEARRRARGLSRQVQRFISRNLLIAAWLRFAAGFRLELLIKLSFSLDQDRQATIFFALHKKSFILIV